MSCELSPSASAFSSMLSAFIGSVLNGLFSGFWIAFFTGWISWLAVIRIVGAGLYEFYLTIGAGTDFRAVAHKNYSSIGMNTYDRGGKLKSGAAASSPPAETEDEEARLTHDMDAAQETLAAQHHPAIAANFQKRRARGSKSLLRMFEKPERTVTIFGWLGWTWSAIYTPISQTIWLSVHIASGEGALLFVRALAISVSALGLTFDFKQRYAAALGQKFGAWSFVLFNTWNAAACLLLGLESAALMIRGALNMSFTPIPLLIAYPIFSIIWAFVSSRILPPIDGARPGKNIVFDVLMGAFAGLFVAAPAFALWQSRKFDADSASLMGESTSSGMSLGDYLSCEGASVLQKYAAIMP